MERVKSEDVLATFAATGIELLRAEDPQLHELITKEYRRQMDSLALVASCSVAHPSTLACEGGFTSNVTAEGYPGARYHAGCEFVDQFESLAIERAKQAFGAAYANVQPNTASTANQVVMASLMSPGETLLGMDLGSGGHLSHGSSVNLSGKLYRAFGYGLDDEGYIDYQQVEDLALEHRPRMIICGTTAYPRAIDFQRFRDIADKVGAYLFADITHVAGLVIAGLHPNPVDVAHVTTTCTHKQLYGPRGGLILMGELHESAGPDGKRTLAQVMNSGVFPLTQGAPIVNSIVAKARALGRALTPEFRQLAGRIVTSAKTLAQELRARGVTLASGGTDNHIILVNVLESFGVTGTIAERGLEECNVIVNKNWIPKDTKPSRVTSGIRIGTNSIAARALSDEGIRTCADLIVRILSTVQALDDHEYALADEDRDVFRAEVREICRRFPLPDYPPLPA